jgi:hypothetical protein
MSDEEKRFVLRQTEDAKKREKIHETTVLQIYVATSEYTRTRDYHAWESSGLHGNKLGEGGR